MLGFKLRSLCCQANISLKQRHSLSSLSYGSTKSTFRLSDSQTAFRLTSHLCIWEVCFTLPRAGSNFLPSCSWAAPKPRGSSIKVTSPSSWVVALQIHQHQTPGTLPGLQHFQGSRLWRATRLVRILYAVPLSFSNANLTPCLFKQTWQFKFCHAVLKIRTTVSWHCGQWPGTRRTKMTLKKSSVSLSLLRFHSHGGPTFPSDSRNYFLMTAEY